MNFKFLSLKFYFDLLQNIYVACNIFGITISLEVFNVNLELCFKHRHLKSVNLLHFLTHLGKLLTWAQIKHTFLTRQRCLKNLKRKIFQRRLERTFKLGLFKTNLSLFFLNFCTKIFWLKFFKVNLFFLSTFFIFSES